MPSSPHLNQPGGELRPSTHPRAASRERELRSLADAVRRLVAITVDSDADATATADAARRLHALADELGPALVPNADPPKHVAAAADGDSHPHDFFQFDPVLGLYNPLALPVEMTWDAPIARGAACFTSAYEGPPGCVHGAVIAATFDQIFNVANLKSGVAGPTAYLHVDYRRPTLLRRDLVFEGWVDDVDGRKVRCRGRIVQGETVTCEADGLFVQLPRDEVTRLSDR